MDKEGGQILAFCRPDGMTEVWNNGRRRLVPTSPEAAKRYNSRSPSHCWTPDMKKPTYSENKDGRCLLKVEPIEVD